MARKISLPAVVNGEPTTIEATVTDYNLLTGAEAARVELNDKLRTFKTGDSITITTVTVTSDD